MSGPELAVVGRVNKGKSSVIATLAEDARVVISPTPGTTREATRFPVKVDDTVLFTLVDTPGFEEAQRALAWMESTNPSPSERAARVRAFVDAFEGTQEFVEERKLLCPILDGAGILYVVDGTQPYRDNYKAEMEILRWTGMPRMALVNRVGRADHAEQWRNALLQFFSVVRDFDAHLSTFSERLRLLTTFRELHDPWRADLDAAIHALEAERARRREESADIITDLLVEALTFTLETRVEHVDQREVEKRKIEEAFHAELRAKEQRARRAVQQLYRHQAAWTDETQIERPTFDQDLFAKQTWDVLGLSGPQILALYTMAGAAVGGVIDAGVGGAAFLTGTVIGAVTGAGAGAMHLSRRFARAASADGAVEQLRRAFSGGVAFRVGPHAHPSFPFVLLDRALLHHQSVRTRTHARRDAAVVEKGEGPTQTLDDGERKALHELFTKIRKSSEVPHEVRRDLRDRVRARLEVGEQ